MSNTRSVWLGTAAALALLAAVGAGVLATSTRQPRLTAQESPGGGAKHKPSGSETLIPAPSFDAAPIGDVLAWASRNAGLSFMARDGVLMQDDGKTPLRVSYKGGVQLGTMQATLLVYELMRSVGLVPMPVVGMPAGTHSVVKTTEAAGVGTVAAHIEDLEGAYFGTLALEAWSVPVKELESLVRKLASPHAVITVFEPTSKLVVADFADTLSVIWDAHIDAQTHAERDDDIVSEFARPAKHDAAGLAMALSASLSPEEKCRVVVHGQSGTLLVTGQRKHVHAVLDRFDALEEQPVLPGQSRVLNLFYPNILPVGVLADTARGFFATEVAIGTMRISAIESRKHLVVESSQADWQRIQKFLADVDVPARSVAEAEGDVAWMEQRAAERMAAEREAAAQRAAEKDNPPERKKGLPGLPPDGK